MDTYAFGHSPAQYCTSIHFAVDKLNYLTTIAPLLATTLSKSMLGSYATPCNLTSVHKYLVKFP